MAFTKCPKCEQPVWEGMACPKCGGERVGDGVDLDPVPMRSAAGETFAAIARVTVILVLVAVLVYAVFFWRKTEAEAEASADGEWGRTMVEPDEQDEIFCGQMNVAFTAAGADVPDEAYKGCALVTRSARISDDWRRMRYQCSDTAGAFLVKCVQSHY